MEELMQGHKPRSPTDLRGEEEIHPISLSNPEESEFGLDCLESKKRQVLEMCVCVWTDSYSCWTRLYLR